MRKASEKQDKGEDQQDDVPKDTLLKYQYIESPSTNYNQQNQINKISQMNQQYEIIHDEDQYNNIQDGMNYVMEQGNQVNQPYYINIEDQTQENQEFQEEQENFENQQNLMYQIEQENEGNGENMEDGEENIEYEEIEEAIEYPDNIEYIEGERQESQENIQNEGQIKDKFVKENINYKSQAMDNSYKINKDENAYEVDEETKKNKINSPHSPNKKYQIKKQNKETSKILKNENSSSIVQDNIRKDSPKTNSHSKSFKRKSIKSNPKDNLPKVYIQSSGKYDNYYQGKYFHYNGEIPRYMSFQKTSLKNPTKIRSSINVTKAENVSEFIEIPKSKYQEYAGKETIFIGEGMNTGEYKFRGQGIVISQSEIPQKILIREEDILKEINRRKNKPKKEKKKKYEIIDRFYSRTMFEGKPIKKIEKIENSKQQYEYQEQEKYFSSSKGNIAYEINSKDFQSPNIYFNVNNQSQQSKNSQQIKFKIINQSQVSQPFSQSKIQSQIESNFQDQHFQYKNNQSGNNSININNKELVYNIDYASTPSDNFSKYLFEQINKLRKNPQSYIKVIQNAKKNIIKNKYGRLIYNGKIKIALTSGETAFNNAINYLSSVKPMEPLIFNKYLVVEMPQSENEIKYKNYLRLKVENMINDGINIKSYWKDIIKDPEISILMMIVDDNGDNSGMRRKDLLDSNMKYIGINSIDINGNFVCYITLSEMI